MDKLKIPDKGVDDIMLKHPINDWLAIKRRYSIVCTTVGHVRSGYKDAEGVFLITHSKTVLHGQSQTVDAPIERERDKYVKKWLVDVGGAKEDSLQWMSFPDADEFRLLADGKWPRRNCFKGPSFHYRLTDDQSLRLSMSGKEEREWVEEAIVNGEVVDRIWSPQ